MFGAFALPAYIEGKKKKLEKMENLRKKISKFTCIVFFIFVFLVLLFLFLSGLRFRVVF